MKVNFFSASMLNRAAAAALLSVFVAAPLALTTMSAPIARETGGPTQTVRYRTAEVDGIRVFYREAGPADGPVILLLHGFPSSSHMFRNLIPALASRYRVIAPDLPGFGETQVPEGRNYRYSFDSLAATMAAFTDAIGLNRYAIYVFDYGAPVGLRLALRNPERIAAIISQNGNAYVEGLSKDWSPIQAYWRDPSDANRQALRGFLKLETTRWQYTQGVSDPSLVSPDGWRMDQQALDRPGNAEIQLDLFGDYKSNVALYPQFQQYFRDRKPPLLAVWGKNDPFFVPAGAEAFRRDNPNAVVKFVDSGHFALETHAGEIGTEILQFLSTSARF